MCSRDLSTAMCCSRLISFTSMSHRIDPTFPCAIRSSGFSLPNIGICTPDDSFNWPIFSSTSHLLEQRLRLLVRLLVRNGLRIQAAGKHRQGAARQKERFQSKTSTYFRASLFKPQRILFRRSSIRIVDLSPSSQVSQSKELLRGGMSADRSWKAVQPSQHTKKSAPR